jgi:phosphoglycolate phosphatase
MDGTVVDSTYDWAAIRAELAIDGSILDGLESLEEPDRSHRRELLEARERAATEGACVHEGASELLELLAARRVRTALVTNNTAANTSALLTRFHLGFDVVVTRDDGVWKPSPEPILLALDRLGVAPGVVLAVGDSSFDIAAARGAGCRCVAAVLDGAHLEADADLVFADLPALIRYLRLLLPPE